MKNLIKSRTFIISFLISYFAFFILTIFVFDIKSSGIGVGSMNYGFPLTYFQSHCFGGTYSWLGLIGNVIFAGVLSFFIGFAAAHLNVKFSLPEFRAKWHL